jgi:hypothetical protein
MVVCGAVVCMQGVKGFVTVNVLVFDEELPRLEERVRQMATAGVDAVIVQVSKQTTPTVLSSVQQLNNYVVCCVQRIVEVLEPTHIQMRLQFIRETCLFGVDCIRQMEF